MTSYIYIIYSNSIDNSNLKDLYTGRAQDWVIKSVFEVENESVAIKIERFIRKQKSRNLIERLFQEDFVGEKNWHS
jgi:hypothetical protein